MNRYLAVVSAALIAAVISLGIGHATAADSASSYTDQQILRELKQINQELDAIKYNTGAVCQDTPSGFSCRKF